MKKIIGICIVTAFSFILFTGCQKINGGEETDRSDSEPSVYDETSAADNSEASDDGSYTAIPPEHTTVQTSDNAGTSEGESSVPETADQIIGTAESLIGTPFAMNGISPETGFDNPGFIYYVLRENGFINCPRFIADQASMGTKTDYGSLKKGDLIFFSTDGSGKADFGGIYTGGGQMIYCPYPGQTVQNVSITSDYWVNAFYTGVRLS
ncbi:MAG TPA: hypothetical protein DDX91_02050 [Ruminococcaceae bacterium]|nr:hypothetical protein [Oscillospiraceae bacterium]